MGKYGCRWVGFHPLLTLSRLNYGQKTFITFSIDGSYYLSSNKDDLNRLDVAKKLNKFVEDKHTLTYMDAKMFRLGNKKEN